MNMLDAPFTYFGGKRRTAPIVWDLLGDVDRYAEPFAGSLAVLLGRLDPPYTVSADLYHVAGDPLHDAITEWASAAPPDLRIVISGYDGEYPALEAAGWTVRKGLATKGHTPNGGRSPNGDRERVWASPGLTEAEAALW